MVFQFVWNGMSLVLDLPLDTLITLLAMRNVSQASSKKEEA